MKNINPKIILLWVVVIVVIAIILFIIYRQIKKAVQTSKDKQLVDEADKQIVENKLTYTKADYKAMADKLYIAMNGPGTDEDSIKEVLNRLRTRSDLLSLIVAFGVRKSTNTSFSGNLVQWLNDELDQSERKEVNDILAKFNYQI